LPVNSIAFDSHCITIFVRNIFMTPNFDLDCKCLKNRKSQRSNSNVDLIMLSVCEVTCFKDELTKKASKYVELLS